MANQVLYGFVNLQNLFDRRVEDVAIDVVNRAIDSTVAEHNRQINALMDIFVEPTDRIQLRYRTPSTARLQPLDEQGRARPIRPAGQYDVAFPLQMAGTAWGETWLARRKMTVGEAAEITATLLMADARWMRDHILGALFVEGSWTFNDDEHGALTVKGPASGDTDTYLILEGADTGATDDHILAQAAAIADGANPFPTIKTELLEHPENTGEVVTFVASNLTTAITGLTNFYERPDPNIALGTGNNRLASDLGIQTPGTLLGYVDENWIVEWAGMPSGYMISVTTGGEKPLGMRQDPETDLRGFQKVAERNDHPFYESQYVRRAGFGALNRVGAVVYRIGNAAYAVPTGYESPMP